MKYLLLIPLILATCFKPIMAGELSVTAGQRSMDAGGDDFTVGDWNYTQITYKPKDSKFYYGLSIEDAEVAPVSYFSWTYSMIGAVVGTESKLNDNVTLFGQVGYYLIDNNISNADPIPEGVLYYLNNKFHGNNVYDQATLENSNAFAGTIGIKISQQITNNLKVGFVFSKRMMKIRENLRARFAINHDWIWAVSGNRDYSSTSFGLNLNYLF